ncbi:MAG: alkaline phosphatase, partial [Thermoleophilia bacterium]|nr:alkaline phosphatase [Thermoleophilia bacterium]
DLVIGAHNPWYNLNGEKRETPVFSDTSKYLWKESTWNDLVAGKIGNDADGDGEVENWSLIESRADFQAMMTGETPERVAGVIQNAGDDGIGSGYTQFYRTGAADDTPFTVPLLETSPTLTEMSMVALNVLDQDPDGFVVMIEGANIDYGNHFGWLGRAIEEQIDFNDAVQAVHDWVEANSNWGETLLIVTSDHETGGIWGPDSTAGMAEYPSAPRFIVRGDPTVFVPIVNNGAGELPTVTYYNHRAQYDNPDTGVKFYWHTNALVPVYAKGANAAFFKTQVRGIDPVRGAYIDNTDIFDVMYHSIMK